MSIDDVLVELDGVSAVYPREDVIEALFRKVAEECADAGMSPSAATMRLRQQMLLHPEFIVTSVQSIFEGTFLIEADDGRVLKLVTNTSLISRDAVDSLVSETIIGINSTEFTIRITTNKRELVLHSPWGSCCEAYLNGVAIPLSF